MSVVPDVEEDNLEEEKIEVSKSKSINLAPYSDSIKEVLQTVIKTRTLGSLCEVTQEKGQPVLMLTIGEIGKMQQQ